MRALITQRENIDSYGVPIDVLENTYIRYFESLGVDVWPISNFKSDVTSLFDNETWDFLILTGGGSVPNHFYDLHTDDTQQLNRDRVESLLVEECIKRKIPIFAICRGMQFINGFFGGKISSIKQLQVKRSIGKDHPVVNVNTSERFMVNNYHNDGIFLKNLSDKFNVLALDADNEVVEAFYSDELMIYAVQWHPERQFQTADAREYSLKLVSKFIKKYVSSEIK